MNAALLPPVDMMNEISQIKITFIFYLRPFLDLSLLPSTVRALYSHGEKTSALSSLVDWRLIASEIYTLSSGNRLSVRDVEGVMHLQQ